MYSMSDWHNINCGRDDEPSNLTEITEFKFEGFVLLLEERIAVDASYI